MKRFLIPFLSILSLLLFLGSARNYSPQGYSLDNIIKQDNPIEKLTASEVKLYFARKIKQRWPSFEKNIHPATRKTKCVERDAFYCDILGMSEDAVDEYFTNKKLQNAEPPPDNFSTGADLANFVAEESGAIGFIRQVL